MLNRVVGIPAGPQAEAIMVLGGPDYPYIPAAFIADTY
jgi:hypothetical protein